MTIKKPFQFKRLKKGLAFLGALILLAFLALVLIIGQPQGSETPAVTPPPALSRSPARSIQKESDIPQLLTGFPVPVMSFLSGSGMIFLSGTASWQNGVARILTLAWQTPEGQLLTLQSIYPADPELIGKDDYRFSTTAGPRLFGQTTVRMENRDMLRIHTTAADGLYVLILPRDLSDSLSSLSQSIQLFTLNTDSDSP